MDKQKTRAVVAYVFGLIGGLIILLGMKDNTRSTRIHAAQSISLSLLYYIVALIGYFLLPSFIVSCFSLVYFAVIIIGIVKVSKDEDPEIPGLADMAKAIFATQIDVKDPEPTTDTANTANTKNTEANETTNNNEETETINNTDNNE